MPDCKRWITRTQYDSRGSSWVRFTGNQSNTVNHVQVWRVRGLRATLRQDPDVISIGEIRDGETAEIATQASLTGHLVLCYILIQPGHNVQSWCWQLFITSTVRGIISQRLLRKLCRLSGRGKSWWLPKRSLARKGTKTYRQRLPKLQQHRPLGVSVTWVGACHCALQALIHEKAGELELEQAIRDQVPSIREAGFELVRQGLTTVEEVLRVTSV